jgi:hypothetical protein
MRVRRSTGGGLTHRDDFSVRDEPGCLGRPAGEGSAADPLAARNAGRRNDLSASLTTGGHARASAAPDEPARAAQKVSFGMAQATWELAPRQIQIETLGVRRAQSRGH